jgi:hypothetical protein
MPETAEMLGFDNHGVCSVCRQVEFKQSAIAEHPSVREGSKR